MPTDAYIGRLESEGNNPIAGAVVQALWIERMVPSVYQREQNASDSHVVTFGTTYSQDLSSAPTSDNGEFLIPRRLQDHPGQLVLAYTDGRNRIGVQRITMPFNDAVLPPLNCEPIPRMIVGEVFDDRGVPAAGVEIVLGVSELIGRAIDRRFGYYETLSDGQGRFFLPQPHEDFALAVVGGGYGSPEGQGWVLTLASNARVTLQAARRGSLRGRITDAANGDPISGAEIRCNQGDAAKGTYVTGVGTVSSDRGRFEVPLLPGALERFELTVKAPGYQSMSKWVLVANLDVGKPQEMEDIRLTPEQNAIILNGSADFKGEPHSAAIMIALHKGDHVSARDTCWQGHTDSRGVFRCRIGAESIEAGVLVMAGDLVPHAPAKIGLAGLMRIPAQLVRNGEQLNVAIPMKAEVGLSVSMSTIIPPEWRTHAVVNVMEFDGIRLQGLEWSAPLELDVINPTVRSAALWAPAGSTVRVWVGCYEGGGERISEAREIKVGNVAETVFLEPLPLCTVEVSVSNVKSSYLRRAAVALVPTTKQGRTVIARMVGEESVRIDRVPAGSYFVALYPLDGGIQEEDDVDGREIEIVAGMNQVCIIRQRPR